MSQSAAANSDSSAPSSTATFSFTVAPTAASAAAASAFSFTSNSSTQATPPPSTHSSSASSSSFSFGAAPQSTPSSSPAFILGGSSTSPSSSTTSAPAFGASASSTPSSTFGSSSSPASAFGSTTSTITHAIGTTSSPSTSLAPTGFGAGGGMFGATPPASTGASLFGGATTSAPTTGSSLFGGTTPAFGASASSNSTSTFGSSSSLASCFGSTTSTPTFGATPSTSLAPTGFGLFGALTSASGCTSAPRTPGFAGGGLFGAPASAFGSNTSPAPTGFGGGCSGFTQPATSSFHLSGTGTGGGFVMPTTGSAGFSFGTSSSAITPPFSSRPNVERLFDRSDFFPDVILSHQGRHIYAHKAILALASVKLKKMFTDTEEPAMQDGLPVFYLDDDMKGIQFNDVSRIIKFCYSGQFEAELPVPRLIQIALLATELGMFDLSLLCQAQCIKQVTAEPFAEDIIATLDEAHRNGLVQLKKACMDSLIALPAERRFKIEDLTRLDKDLLTEFLVHITGSVQFS